MGIVVNLTLRIHLKPVAATQLQLIFAMKKYESSISKFLVVLKEAGNTNLNLQLVKHNIIQTRCAPGWT